MIYNVASLLTSREGATRQAEVEDSELFTDRHHFYEISGPVHMLRTDRTVLVSASVSAKFEETCSRCLTTAHLTIDVDFEEEFEPANSDLMSERPSPEFREFDPALVIDERNMLDMTDALAQSLSAAAPMAPVCRDDCAGICTVCFANRNLTVCTCDQTPIDPRWQLLAELGARASNSPD